MPLGRVLVVSPDLRVREMLGGILSTEGYDVHAEADVKDPPTVLTSFMPDVLLVHVSNPTLPTSDIFHSRRRLGVPLVIISSLDESPSLAITLEADALFRIPVPVPDLLIAVRRLCDRGGACRFLVIHSGERRSSFRPRTGDVRPCPRCGDAMRFEERRADQPAWVCRNTDCRNAELVRARTRQ